MKALQIIGIVLGFLWAVLLVLLYALGDEQAQEAAGNATVLTCVVILVCAWVSA